MIRHVSLFLSSLAVLGIALPARAAQSDPPAPLAFEVASVKLHPPGPAWHRVPNGARPLRSNGNLFRDQVSTVQDLIMDAYGIEDYRIAGLPGWAQRGSGDLYDIEARTPGDGAPTSAQLRLMLQSLLAERFHLKLHRETKELPVYVLLAAKNGAKLKPVPPGAPELPRQAATGTKKSDDSEPHPMRASIAMTVNLLGLYLDRPLLDRTGLTAAEYEFTWDAHDVLESLRSAGKPAPAVFAAVQEQLGLKIEAQKGNVELLAVDSIERPTGN